ncbi:MAG: glycosyltransferase family 4 protein [Oscillochloris sp.]|nr:glycosyltransferase family 4 protein [Oscillochloris sp.]
MSQLLTLITMEVTAMKLLSKSKPQDRIRVLIFSNSVIKGGLEGGMEKHMKLLARHLNREQFEVFGICQDADSVRGFAESFRKECDHFAAIPIGYHPSSFFRLISQIRSWRIQIMHMHNGAYLGQNFVLPVARLAGVKSVYVTEHLPPEDTIPLTKRVVRDLFTRFIDGVVCVSEKNYLSRSQFLYTPADHTFVVNNGIDMDDFQPIPKQKLIQIRQQYNIPADAQVLGTAVRFEQGKGLNYLINAMPAIRAACPRAHLLLVGDGSLRADLEQQVANLGMQGYVHFTGFQSDPRPYLGMMEIFVLPVPFGSASIALLEAMAMSIPSIISFGGKGEAVVPGESGYWAEPHSSESIAEHVINILRDPSLQRKLSEGAYSRIKEHFSAQQAAVKLGTIYAEGLYQLRGAAPH